MTVNVSSQEHFSKKFKELSRSLIKRVVPVMEGFETDPNSL